MKKKTQVISILDDLRSQDPKKRLNSVQSLKEIATALGPVKTRTELIQFLNEFIDDQQHIVLQLLGQLSDFSSVLGGQQHEKCLLPLLISFCKTDEKSQAQKATQIIRSILIKNKDLVLDVVKKLSKSEMNTSKQACAKLISSLINLVQQNQSQLLQIYSSLAFSDVPAYRIIGAKHLPKLLQNIKNKEEISKVIEMIYNQNEDLPKMFALEALVNFYTINTNLVLSKFKALFGMNNWRINIKICEIICLAVRIFSKVHFKLTFESGLVKFLDSPEPELRAKACGVLKDLGYIMSEQEIKKTLVPVIKKLSADPINYVRVQLSENMISLVEVCPPSILNSQILPIVFGFIKNNELAIGIFKNFQSISKKLSNQTIQQKILIPLTTQLNNHNWRTKCRLIQLFGNAINNPIFLNEKIITVIIGLITDPISAVRIKSTELFVNIINQQPPQFSDKMIIPKLACLNENKNYIQRQVLLEIIEKTADKVSQKTLSQIYRPIIMGGLIDKVPNVRAKALRTLRLNKRLNDRMFEKYVQKLKNDVDGEVKEMALSILKA